MSGLSSSMQRALLLICTAATFAGCASTPAPTLLTLPSTVRGASTVQATPSSGESRPVLAIGRIELPEYLVARRVRYRADASTLKEWPDTFWAERIEVSVSREFAVGLRHRLADWTLCESNCSEQIPLASLQIIFDSFDFERSEKRLHTSVRISLVNGQGPKRSIANEQRSFDIAVVGDTPQSQADASTKALRRVVEEAGAMVAALGKDLAQSK